MKKLVDDTRLIYKCCYLYYQDNMSQQEVCRFLGISRPTVSRMLQRGKELGIVKIELVNPDNVIYGQIEHDIEKEFHLQEVIIVPSSPLVIGGKTNKNSELGKGTLHFLERILKDGDYVGVSMGSTLRTVVQTDYFISEKIGCTFVPVLGGVGESYLEFHANYLCQRLARLFNAKCVQFFSPAVFSSEEVLQGFLKETTIAQIIRLYKDLQVILLGIGVPDTQYSTILQTGYVDKRILHKFSHMGAVGDIVLRYFDIHGDTRPFDEFNKKVAGISLENLKKVPRRIGIAAGPQKAKAVLGAIRGGYVNNLILDIDCAQALCDIKDKV